MMQLTRICCQRLLPTCAILTLTLGTSPAVAQISELVVGVTPTCPYGLDACWAGAYEALMRMEGVESVETTPNSYNCTARLHMTANRLPDPDRWAEEFRSMVDQAYVFRGIEMTAAGTLEQTDRGIVLKVPGIEPRIKLDPLRHKLQWNIKKAEARQPEPDEREAHALMEPWLSDASKAGGKVQVTGPLTRSGDGYHLEVREFFPLERDDASPGDH